MALIVVASAKGAPGVTTLTVALGALTPGSIVADLDPDGGDLALRYGREDGTPLDPEVGLLSLAASLRRDHSEVVSPTGPVDEHVQVTAGGLDVLLGVAGPDQAVGLGPLWAPLARALAETERTVFADCGRLGPSSPAMPVLMQADAVLLLARAELEELAHLRERLRFLTMTLPSRYAGPARIGVILVAKERDRSAGPRTEQLLRASGLAVPVLGTIADDPRGAGRLRGQHGGRAGRTTLVRSVRSLLPAVTALTGTALTVGILTEAALTNEAALTGAPLPDTDPTGDDSFGVDAADAAGAADTSGAAKARSARLGSRRRAANSVSQAVTRAPVQAPVRAPVPPPLPLALPTPLSSFGAEPETDIWLGTRAAAAPAPVAHVAPAVRPVPAEPEAEAEHGVRSPYQHGWAPAPVPESDPGASESDPGAPDPESDPGVATILTTDLTTDQALAIEQVIDDEQGKTFQPSENGWPRPGRGSGTFDGVASTVTQNWGR